MGSDEDIKEITKGIEVLGRNQQRIYDSLPGIGLYLMAGIAMIAGVRSCSKVADIQERISAIPPVQVQNVIGQEAPEKFYESNGQRIFLEVDGRPIESYFRE